MQHTPMNRKVIIVVGLHTPHLAVLNYLSENWVSRAQRNIIRENYQPTPNTTIQAGTPAVPAAHITAVSAACIAHLYLDNSNQ